MIDQLSPAFAIPVALILWPIIITGWIRDRKALMNNKKLRTSEVANLFGVTRRTVQIWADEGALSSTRTIGGDRRFDAAEVDRKLQGL